MNINETHLSAVGGGLGLKPRLETRIRVRPVPDYFAELFRPDDVMLGDVTTFRRAGRRPRGRDLEL